MNTTQKKVYKINRLAGSTNKIVPGNKGLTGRAGKGIKKPGVVKHPVYGETGTTGT